MFQKKPSASEVDGVQYRRAKLWQIICYACNAFVGMSVYSLIGMASYSASIGYGITTATVGLILMLARILDGFTDPMLAFVYDRVNTRFGKLRVLLISGYLIEAVGLLCMFNLCSSKGFGLPVFALTYIIYIIGYTVTNMTAQTLPAIMTNDPRQRPTIGVWSTALNYAVPMGMSMLIYTVILPKCGGTFNQDFLSTVCTIVLIIAGIGTLIVCAGISAYDKPENFEGTNKKHEPLKTADILEVLKHNKPLQCYIASNASDKLAQQVGSQAIINTMLNGILIGNMGLATTLGVISMVPSIFFAAFGAKYVGKKGSKKGIVTWTCIRSGLYTSLTMILSCDLLKSSTICLMTGAPKFLVYTCQNVTTVFPFSLTAALSCEAPPPQPAASEIIKRLAAAKHSPFQNFFTLPLLSKILPHNYDTNDS